MRHSGTTTELLFERMQRHRFSFGPNFNLAVRKIAGKTVYPQPLRDVLGEISITDALYPPANQIAFCRHA